MIVSGLTDFQYRRIHLLLVAERKRIRRRVQRHLATECGVGFGMGDGK